MYEDNLTNLRAAVPARPGTYLWRGNLAPRQSPCGGFPFTLLQVRRRWFLFGAVGFNTKVGFMPASHWSAQHWRVPT